MTVKPFAFVLMPFDDTFDDIYKLGIQAVATECGVVAERVDEQTFSETILERIYRQIDAADFVIADMTGRNPNVFYEVGYAHAHGKLCTLLTQSADDIPFDMKHHRHVIYNGSIQTLKSKLTAEINWLKSEREKQKTNAFSIELKSANGILEKTKYSATAVVDIVIYIANKSKRKSPEIDAIYIHTAKGWTFSQSGEDCAHGQSELVKKVIRHFVKAPITKLSPGMWGQIKVKGKRQMASTWKGDELKDSYDLTGYIIIEVYTSEGTFTENLDLSLSVDELPF
ncbi:nucleoside 2-deoxyribosyltransferase [Sphingobium sp. AP50]|uniref:nucleoside 2-deoxyribosyltransferase n=1 Tax=Sphingobium sp. AP50 TaxID=1884369 RepID=UPI001C431EDD|nr:nucleoside 2-deoxyribosyltransferase [Sphingobium sp. AP50]